jgi:[ribosomal protein S5]-alanine N-acetyltransferase
VDARALQFVLDRIDADPPAAVWWLYFVILRDSGEGRVVIGTAGYKGPPDTAGTVEIGYGIVSDRHRRGYAAEAAEALTRWAFVHPAVARVIAETYPELAGSIGVLKKCGFEGLGEGSEPGVIRFGLSRAAWMKMHPESEGEV